MMMWLGGAMTINNARQERNRQAKNFLPIAWHPLWQWEWCMPEDEKKYNSRGKTNNEKVHKAFVQLGEIVALTI